MLLFLKIRNRLLILVHSKFLLSHYREGFILIKGSIIVFFLIPQNSIGKEQIFTDNRAIIYKITDKSR